MKTCYPAHRCIPFSDLLFGLGLFLVLILGTSCSETETHSSPQTQDQNMDIIFTDSAGNRLTREELSQATGRFNFAILGAEHATDKAKSLHSEARMYGQQGDYPKAIELLKQAIADAPEWPYPYYDLGYTYLLNEDFASALTYYRLTDSLCPGGFFTSQTALYTLEKERDGTYPPGLYMTYLSLEWMDNPAEKLELVRAITETYPDYAPGWKELSTLLDGAEREEAIDKGLSLDADAETRGILQVNKAILLDEKGEKDAARDLLGQVIFGAASSSSNREIAKLVMKQVMME